MSSKKEPDNKVDRLPWLQEGDEDPFSDGGLFTMEDDELIRFICMDCKGEDEVPDFVVDEFSYDLSEGEEVETVCPHCHGTMRMARDVPSD